MLELQEALDKIAKIALGSGQEIATDVQALKFLVSDNTAAISANAANDAVLKSLMERHDTIISTLIDKLALSSPPPDEGGVFDPPADPVV